MVNLAMAVGKSESAGTVVETTWKVHENGARTLGHVDGVIAIIDAVLALVQVNQRLCRGQFSELRRLGEGGKPGIPCRSIRPDPAVHGNTADARAQNTPVFHHDFVRRTL